MCSIVVQLGLWAGVVYIHPVIGQSRGSEGGMVEAMCCLAHLNLENINKSWIVSMSAK